MKTYTGQIAQLEPHQIFVFGSNTQGRHGKGAALIAKQKFGAIYGKRSGFQGQCYAIVTKDISKKPYTSMTKEYIVGEILDLYQVAKSLPDKEFLIAYKGTGTNLNGYTPQEMANMFAEASWHNRQPIPIPDNIVFEKSFAALVQEQLDWLFQT